MPFYQQLKLLLSFYVLQPMKFEVHDKQYYVVNKVEKGAASKKLTIFIVKTEVLAGEIFFIEMKIPILTHICEKRPLK